MNSEFDSKHKIDFTRWIETERVVIGLRKDGVLHVYYKSQTSIDKDFQHWLLIAYNYVTEGKKYPFIIEGGEFVEVKKEGKEYLEEIQEEVPIISNAILVNNTAQLILASFFIKFAKIELE